jgi:hypothetical protein
MKRTIVALVAFFMCFATSFAQLTIGGKRMAYDKLTNTYLLTVPRSTFGSSLTLPIAIDDTVSWVLINGKQVRTSVEFPVVDGETGYQIYFSHNKVITGATIRFTYHPIVTMSGEFNTEYSIGQVQVTEPDSTKTLDLRARIKWAGGTTIYDWIEKHNYHIKLIDEYGEKLDLSFFGLRSDNHWRLDAGIVDMLRFRNKVAHGIWADFNSKPYYAESQPGARNYSRGEHVEVFLNDEYMGFFDMTEFLDRKQMKLKKYDETTGTFRGLMWKGKEVTRQTLFSRDSVVVDTVERWCGFDIMYPDFDDVYPTDYSVLNRAINFVATSDDSTFAEHVGEYFDLPVLADYYVFIQMLFAIDNSSKNIIWGCYNSALDQKLTLSVWDLEATVGQHWYDGQGYYHASEIQPENDLETCRFTALSRSKLFMRLKQVPAFWQRVMDRYWELRNTVLDPDSLIARYQATFDVLRTSGALERERERWTGSRDLANRQLDFQGELDYLSDWIRRRVNYLDHNTFAIYLLGDANGDGLVTISDVTLIIDYLLTDDGSALTAINADVDLDGNITIADVTALIDMLLVG